MPVIEPKNKSLKSLTGIHLWHAPLSSCSQRVRLVLAETGRTYESHIVDLEKDEHASAEYQAIHPNGLVPALVDDGELLIESIDIIRHVAGEGSTLLEASSPDLLAMADAAQQDLKLLTFEFLFRSGPPPSAAQVEAFESGHENDWLKQFKRDFAKGFAPDRIDAAVDRTFEAFDALETLLSDGRSYLSGETFSLSDIAWLPNVHRFSLMGWPFDDMPELSAWFSRVSARPSFEEALIAWQGKDLAEVFSSYTAMRKEQGTCVAEYGNFKQKHMEKPGI